MLIESFNLDTGEARIVAQLDPNARLGKYGRISVSPDGRWVLYPHREGSGADLVRIEGLRR